MLKVMLFFPSITFGLIGAEIFPWAILYVIVRIKSINPHLLPFVISLFISFITTSYIYDGHFIPESIRSTFAYLNPILLFMLLAHSSEREILQLINILKYVLPSLLIIGIVQSSGLIQFLDPFFKMMVPRGGAEEFGEGRGVMLLSTEPSRAAFEIVFLYATWRVVTAVSRSRILIIDILFALFIIGVVKSAVGATILSIYFLLIYRLKFIFLLAFLAPIALFMFIDARVITVATELVSTSSPIMAYEFLINASGFRLVSVISAYYYGMTSLLGSGIGAWTESSIYAMEAAGFSASEISFFIYHHGADFAGIRPTSYLANISLDLGLLGIACLMYLLIPYINRAWNCGDALHPLLGLFMFSILFYGAVGNPIPWLTLMLAVRFFESARSKQSVSRGANRI